MTSDLPRRDLTHDHYVTVYVTLDCGHERVYRLPMQTVAMNPAYARPGVQWACQPCSPAWPGKRGVTGVRYDYACEPCERAADAADAPPQPLPEFAPYQWAHGHGTHDVAGYVIVQRHGTEGGWYTLEDIQQMSGINSYGKAVTEVREWDSQPDLGHAIVTVYADGCRLDRM